MPSGKTLLRMCTVVIAAGIAAACGTDDAQDTTVATGDPVAFDTTPGTMAPVAPAPGDDTLGAPGAQPGMAPAPGQPPQQQGTAPAGQTPAPQQQQPPAQQPPAAPPAQAAGGNAQAGQQVYAGPGLCFACHGPAAAGTALAPNLTDGQWIWFTSPPSMDEMMTLIRTGVTTPRQYPAPMPANGGGNLSETQLRDVAAYILSLNR